ncbi:uncharacterized protein LOC116577042 [Mustela erminea]|uniref:uncharacterized protein LOC116577042 n=1 Tax=Mustela erminea TaxID=36723 RepID=UPI001386C0AD|nr:uncharacterized protein LOC116577042 [Mustela erminea]
MPGATPFPLAEQTTSRCCGSVGAHSPHSEPLLWGRKGGRGGCPRGHFRALGTVSKRQVHDMGRVWKWTRGARGVQRQHKRVSRRAEHRAGRLVLLLGAAPPAPHACAQTLLLIPMPTRPTTSPLGSLACWCEPSPGAPAGRDTPGSGTGHSGHSIPVALLLGSWVRQRGAHSHPQSLPADGVCPWRVEQWDSQAWETQAASTVAHKRDPCPQRPVRKPGSDPCSQQPETARTPLTASFPDSRLRQLRTCQTKPAVALTNLEAGPGPLSPLQVFESLPSSWDILTGLPRELPAHSVCSRLAPRMSTHGTKSDPGTVPGFAPG